MNKGLKLQVFLTVAPAILLACAGLWLLTHVVRNMEANREAFEDLRNEKWKNLMHDVQGQLRRKSDVKRETVLRQVLAEEPYAQAAFFWRKGEGLACNVAVPPDLAA